MKYKSILILSLSFIIFFNLIPTSKAVSLVEAPVVNGVINSTWQYQGSVKGVAWYMKGTYFSNADGSLQFASSADFSAYLARSSESSGQTLTSDTPIGPGGGLNPGWSFFTNGWYFKNPNYSNENGSLQFGSLNELNAYLIAEEAKKVNAILPPASGCTGYENNASCRPEWAEGVKACITGTLVVSNNNTNGQCRSKITNNLIQTCNAIINDGPCRPERVNPYASAGIAKKAEATAKVKGYSNTSCSAEKIHLGSADNIDPDTGLNYYFNVSCTINGKTGIGAEWMTNGSTAWWSALNDYLSGKSSTINANSASGTNTGTNTGNNSGTNTGIFSTLNTNQSAYIQSMVNTINNIVQKYKDMLNKINTNTQTSATINPSTSQSSSNLATTKLDPTIELTLGNGQKNGTYSVGDTIVYRVNMQNIDSINSFYNTIPGDTCIGGPANGEQKPWIVKVIAPLSVFNDQVKSCQAGSTYVITVTGSNKTSNEIVASSVSVYIRK